MPYHPIALPAADHSEDDCPLHALAEWNEELRIISAGLLYSKKNLKRQVARLKSEKATLEAEKAALEKCRVIRPRKCHAANKGEK